MILSLRRKALPSGKSCCCENVLLLSMVGFQLRTSGCSSFEDVEAQSVAEGHRSALILAFSGPVKAEMLVLVRREDKSLFPAKSVVDSKAWTNFKSHQSPLFNSLRGEQLGGSKEGVKHHPFVSTPCPMTSITPCIKSP